MGDRHSVLIVEDDSVVRGLVKSFLEKKYCVLEASNCSEALEKLPFRLDLAIIDYSLPDCDGLDLSKNIKKNRPGLPVIMITGYGTEDLAIKALRAGITDYIKKPLSLGYLANKIAEIFGDNCGQRDSGHDHLYHLNSESRDDFIMEGIAAYIEDHCAENLTREQLADMVLMNRNKFCNLFKEKFGQTLNSYLHEARINKALDLLKNPDLSITEIAYFVGYESIVHFERIFKEKNGVSPREFRKRMNLKN